MAVPYHEQMHTAIWTWIREYSNSGGEALISVNPSPILILQEIILRIPHEHPPWHPDARTPSYLSPTGNIPIIGTFSEQMCTVAEHLHRTGQQERISWYDMKRTLQFYLSDAKEYWNYINSLDWNYHQVDSYFGLNLHDISHLSDCLLWRQYLLIWDRYLTGTRIYHPMENPQHSGEMFVVEILVRGEDYWGPIISENIFRIQENFLYNPGEQDGELTKKKEALKKIQAIVDEVSDDIGDGAYLKLMNVMQEEWRS